MSSARLPASGNRSREEHTKMSYRLIQPLSPQEAWRRFPIGAAMNLPPLSSRPLRFGEVFVPWSGKTPAQAVFSGEHLVLSGPFTPG